MKFYAKIFNVISIVALVLAIGYFASTTNIIGKSPIGFLFIILLLFLFNLKFMLKGGSNIFRILLIILNVIIGIMVYLPFLAFLIEPRSSTSILIPLITVLISLPFVINIIALIKEKSVGTANG